MLKVDEIKEGIIKITPPADDFNCISSNVFFLTKEGILIDAGGQHYSEEIENIIKKYGTLKKVLLTHLHADHFGNIQSDVPIYCSQLEIEFLKKNPEGALWENYAWRPINGENINVGLQARLLGDYQHWNKRLTLINNGSIEGIKIKVTEGIHSTSGLIYIYNELCFVGDIFAPYDSPFLNNEFNNRVHLMKELLKKFKRENILLGHDKDYFINKEIKGVHY